MIRFRYPVFDTAVVSTKKTVKEEDGLRVQWPAVSDCVDQ
jgi:hypothetical protein